MKPSHLVWFCLLLANTAYSSNSECIDTAVKQRVSAEARQQFIEACMTRQAPSVNPKVRTDPVAATDQPAHASCDTPDRCSDFSTQLEVTAAGPESGAKANSGHSFVRLKRVSN